MNLKKLKSVERLLINVDMVNGFINFGSMHDSGISNIIGAQVDILKRFQTSGNAVMFVKEGHDENASEFAKFPKHCVKGSMEAEIVDELQPFVKNAFVFEKNSTSAVFAKGFLETIAKMVNLKQVIIMGCCTDICVLNLAVPLSNYFDEFNKKVEIIVPKNAVETYDSPTHSRDEYNEIAFKLLKQAGVAVVEKL